AALVVTLTEAEELSRLGVPDLGAEVGRRHMGWLHLPIVDAEAPDARFEAGWPAASRRIHAVLAQGFRVLVHCKGGLGRAGTVAARLAVERGMPAEHAIAAVRAVRPGAIETTAQAAHVRRAPAAAAAAPSCDADAIEDRAVGCLLGLAIGDALGTTVEFRPRDSFPPLTEIVGGGPFGLARGQWTDDTAMALALAESLRETPDLDAHDLMRRFVSWWEEGVYSCTGTCFDIGIATRQALARWQRTGDPFAGSTREDTAGNGSLMRLAPVAVRHWNDRPRLRAVAARQSRTTHGAPQAVDACVAYAEILADAIAGEPTATVLATRPGPWAEPVAEVLAGSWRGRRREAIRSSGYVVHSLEAALWSIARSHDFRDAVRFAANLGEDADTTAAIAGQLAGAMTGASGLPADWREHLAWHDRIEALARDLFRQSVAG
uniref:ADP-ribosylglycohydrolase family protein n=1 Tax=Stella sp. TaxID=2912054 RepID=UPI0035B3907E